MENSRFIKLHILLPWGGLLLGIANPLFIFAYDDDTTHPALTQEIVTFYNAHVPAHAISPEDTEHIITGSKNEDEFGRWMRHYYDPVHNRGLTYLGAQWQSSKEWAQDTITQATYKMQDYPERTLYGRVKDYFSGETDYSWERAIYEYTWGDKKRGLEALGHVLHLIEDASVPDHTRDDPHPGFDTTIQQKFSSIAPDILISFLGSHDSLNGSPYEGFAVFARGSISVQPRDKSPVHLNSLNEYFDIMAGYSNGKFFSRDTILNSNYEQPIVAKFGKEKLTNGITYTFAYANEGHRLFRTDKQLEWRSVLTDVEKSSLYLHDYDNLILTDYWNLLSKQAVLHGAGVVKLFFDEVEKEKHNKELYAKNRSWLGRQVDSFKSVVFGLAGAIYGSSVKLSDLDDDAVEPSPSASPSPSVSPLLSPSSLPSPSISQGRSPSPLVSPRASIGPSSSPWPLISQSFSEGESPFRSPVASPLPSPSPRILLISFASSPIRIISGAASAGPAPASSLSSDIPTFSRMLGHSSEPDTSPVPSRSPDASPSPKLSPSPSPSSSPNPSEESTPAPSPAPAPVPRPQMSFSVDECVTSLASDGCLVTALELHLSWSATSSAPIEYYRISCQTNGEACPNFAYDPTTATSTAYSTHRDNSAYAFTAVAVDQRQEESNPQTFVVDVATRPLVINEIARAGTGKTPALAKDEWVELYNPTLRTITLDGLILSSPSNPSFRVPLAGTISPRGFYLIERADDTTISDIQADLVADFGNGLSDSGETLVLMASSSGAVLDKTPSCSGWCPGTAGDTPRTMERFNPQGVGDDPRNWGTSGSFIARGRNADGQPIGGTPRSRNSINYLITFPSSAFEHSATLTKADSPFIVPTDYEVRASVELTLEPGVVIKFMPNASLTVRGTISVQGIEAEPIVFTSFFDDAFGGDIAGDATSTAPSAGDWRSLRIVNGGSVGLEHAILRYGGNPDTPFGHHRAILHVDNASATVKNSVIEFSKQHGVYLAQSDAVIEHTTIGSNRFHQNMDSAGIMAVDGQITIANSTISDNTVGIALVTAGSAHDMRIEGNLFTGNVQEAVHVNGTHPVFAGNRARENGLNAVLLDSAAVTQDHVLSANLPYVIRTVEYPVQEGKTLTLEPGVIVKLEGDGSIMVRGTLRALGTHTLPIVFTSIHDDTCGLEIACGDVDSATTTPKAGDWRTLRVERGGSMELEHVIVRYGGNPDTPLNRYRANVYVNNGTINLRDSLIEHSRHYGVYLVESHAEIKQSTIRSHAFHPNSDSAGIYARDGDVLIEGNTIRDNTLGSILASGGNSHTIRVEENLFEHNAMEPILINGAHPFIANNTFRANGINVIATSSAWSYDDGGGNVFE